MRVDGCPEMDLPLALFALVCYLYEIHAETVVIVIQMVFHAGPFLVGWKLVAILGAQTLMVQMAQASTHSWRVATCFI